MAAALAREATEQNWSWGHKGWEKNSDGREWEEEISRKPPAQLHTRCQGKLSGLSIEKTRNFWGPNEVKTHENLAPQLLSEHASIQDLIIQ